MALLYVKAGHLRPTAPVLDLEARRNAGDAGVVEALKLLAALR